MNSACLAMSALQERGREFTAVLASNDMMAFGAIKALSARGLRVPEDVSLMGYDDIPLSSAIRPDHGVPAALRNGQGSHHPAVRPDAQAGPGPAARGPHAQPGDAGVLRQPVGGGLAIRARSTRSVRALRSNP
ncbi:MAG: substrate-binding domain-containing protein, partial [Spirochaetales bacterium]|nr:substrate-binding domain-containing protein [Spirochaetales bacterium]